MRKCLGKLTRMHFVLFGAILLGIYCFYMRTQIQKLKRGVQGHIELTAEERAMEEESGTPQTSRIAGIRADYLNLTKYPLFQSIEEVEFPTVENDRPRIPHIIHQIWENESIPDNFVITMKSFVEQNPTWTYRFWTYASGRKLLINRHPYLVNVYDTFDGTVKKSDLLRYALLYEFGGIYSDLDVMNTRPLDIATMKYACILPTEPFEHSTILNHLPMFINTAVLLCRAKHPFFKQLLLNLQFQVNNLHPVHTAGPGYITKVYMKYNKLEMSDLSRPNIDNDTNSPFFYKGTRHEDNEDGLYIPNTQYFMDKIDPFVIEPDGNLRDCIDGRPLTYLAKRGCAEFEHRRNIRMRRTFAFTLHYWIHMWASKDKYKPLHYLNVKDIIPKCILYEDNS